MKNKLISAALLGLSLSSINDAYALCTPSKGFTSIDISMDVGRVVVRPSDSVGKVLRKATFPITPNASTYSCNGRNDSAIAELYQNYPLSPVGNSIYSTNIPGIGIRLYREAEQTTNFSGFYPYNKPLGKGSYSLSRGYFVVEIIKTATQTGSGALVPGSYSDYYTSGNKSKPFLTSTVRGNAITIASSSCEIQGNINRTIALAPISSSGFSGVGSTQANQGFDLNILCNGASNPSGYEEKNLISLTFDYLPEGNNNNNVLQNSAPAAEKANGVSVQLLWNYQGKNQVIKAGDKLGLGNVSSNHTAQFNVPMSARYYQTEARIRAGKVRAQATVMISYD